MRPFSATSPPIASSVRMSFAPRPPLIRPVTVTSPATADTPVCAAVPADKLAKPSTRKPSSIIRLSLIASSVPSASTVVLPGP